MKMKSSIVIFFLDSIVISSPTKYFSIIQNFFLPEDEEFNMALQTEMASELTGTGKTAEDR